MKKEGSKASRDKGRRIGRGRQRLARLGRGPWSHLEVLRVSLHPAWPPSLSWAPVWGAAAVGGEGFRPWAGEEAADPGLWSGSGGHHVRGQNRGLA